MFGISFKISFRSYLLGLCSIILLCFSIISCESRRRSGNNKPNVDQTLVSTKDATADTVTFYIDNSGGMFGYVTKSKSPDNNFILAVSDLAQNPKFTIDNSSMDYNLINGPDELEITHLGNSAQKLNENLNPNSFDTGDISGNDLNAMIQLALEKASHKNISVFITDAIYDIQDKAQPLVDLRSAGLTTRNHFIERLKNENVQTLLVKLKSYFSGNYFYGVTEGGREISQKRPFYVLIIGANKKLNRYFSNDYLENLDGYVNHTRFFLPKDYEIKYEVSTSYNKIGRFRRERNDTGILRDVTSNPSGDFQFSIGIDYSHLPISEDYLTNPKNYKVNGGYKVVAVDKVRESMVTNITSIEPTHLVTLKTKSLPYGQVSLRLKNKLPSWIKESDTINDQEIVGDTDNTFGFKFLIRGIRDAYKYSSQNEFYTTKTITLSRD